MAEGTDRATSGWRSQSLQLNGSLNYHLNRISFFCACVCVWGGGVIEKDKLHCIQSQNSLMTHMKWMYTPGFLCHWMISRVDWINKKAAWGIKRLCRLVLSPARPALLIDLNKKLNYSILATVGEKRASDGGRRSERSMRRVEGGVNKAWERNGGVTGSE